MRISDWSSDVCSSDLHKERFPMLNEPDPSYHGVVYTEAFGPAAFIGRCRVVPLRNTGAALSPFNAFLVLQGIEPRSEEHTSELQPLMRISYAVLCLQKHNLINTIINLQNTFNVHRHTHLVNH